MKSLKLFAIALLVCFTTSIVSAQTPAHAAGTKHAKTEHKVKKHHKKAKAAKKLKHLKHKA